jgi:hypothetical protein
VAAMKLARKSAMKPLSAEKSNMGPYVRAKLASLATPMARIGS